MTPKSNASAFVRFHAVASSPRSTSEHQHQQNYIQQQPPHTQQQRQHYLSPSHQHQHNHLSHGKAQRNIQVVDSPIQRMQNPSYFDNVNPVNESDDNLSSLPSSSATTPAVTTPSNFLEEYARVCGVPFTKPSDAGGPPTAFDNTCQGGTHHRDIITCLVRKELEQMPDPTYLTTVQSSLKASMTALLYEWIADVCLDDTTRFKRSTLDAAIRNVDRYLSLQTITQSQLQLVGAASLLIAYKFNETEDGAPNNDKKVIDKIIEYSGKAFTKFELFAMEHMMVETLQWRLRPVTANTILEIIVDAEHNAIPAYTRSPHHATNIDDDESEFIIRRRHEPGCNSVLRSGNTDKAIWSTMTNILYLVELNYNILGFPPSVQACAAYAYAQYLHMESKTIFHHALQYSVNLTGQSSAHVLSCVEAVKALVANKTPEKTRSVTPPSVDAASDVLRS